MWVKGRETGDAKITGGYNLSAKFVIHTVGPVWRGGNHNEEQLLASSYRNALLFAYDNNINTIAFPNISTGVYHFPKALASKIAVKEVSEFLNANDAIAKVFFVCFDDENYILYKDLLQEK